MPVVSLAMTILFDIGNVLIHVNVDSFYNRVFGTAELDPKIIAKFIEIRDLHDRGNLDQTSFITQIRDLSPLDVSPEEIHEAWNGMLSPITPMHQVVSDLKKAGHRLILFSNINRIHLPYLLDHYSILHEFHEAQYSCELGEIKPHDHFYEDAIKRFALTPDDTLYFDDLSPNIATGERHGFRCYQYDADNHNAALTWLKLILSPS